MNYHRQSYLTPRSEYESARIGGEEQRFDEDLQRVKKKIIEQKEYELKRNLCRVTPTKSYVNSVQLEDGELSENAKQIIGKYYRPKNSYIDNSVPRYTLEQVEEKSKTVDKEAKTLLKSYSQEETMQQPKSIDEETKIVYEEYIDKLEMQNKELENRLNNIEQGYNDQEYKFKNIMEDNERELREKEEEVVQLQLLNEKYSKELNKYKEDRVQFVLNNTNLKDTNTRELNRLNNLISELSTKVKKKKKKIELNNTEMHSMSNEIIELKRKLNDKDDKIKELIENCNQLKRHLDDQSHKINEATTKFEKLYTKKV